MKRRALTAILWRALRQEPRQLARIVLWSLIETLPALFIGHTIARAINAFAEGRSAAGMAWLALLGGVWVAAAIGAQQVVLGVAQVVEPFRDRLLEHVVRNALQAEHPDTGSAARANLQVEVARDAFAAVLSVLRSFAFTVISVVIGLLTLLPIVAVLVLPPFLLGLVCFLLSLPALARRQRAYLLADERTVGTVTDLAHGLRDIAACGAEDRIAERTGVVVDEQADAARALARMTAVRTVSLALGGWLPILAVLAGTPWLLSRGASAGAVVGALAYVTQSLTPALGGLVEGLGMSGVRLAVTLDRLLVPPAVSAQRRKAVVGDLKVELREVTFAYGPHAAPLLENLSLTLDAGEHLAVVGPSGIGKSTLAGLVSGLLPPDKGEVLVGGVTAGQLDHAARTLIPQEAYVFQGTLLENLVYYAPASPEAVSRAVDAVGLTSLVGQLGGLEAWVDPRSLSAGERQLIALARAYLAPAGLTILDEATCHLDPVAEARAEQAFIDRGGTLIVIAHRISSARRAPRVLLMDGCTVALGTHATLRATTPRYADLLDEPVMKGIA